MTAVGYTSGDPTKVDVAGDTMTGNLDINANLEVEDVDINDDLNVDGDVQVDGNVNIDGTLTAQFGAFDVNVTQLLATGQSTSVFSGGQVTINADPTKVNIAAMTGIVVDYNSSLALSPTNPTVVPVTYAGVVGLVPSFAPFTFFMVNSAGTLVQLPAEPTPTQRRQMVYLGVTLSQAGILLVERALPVIPSQLNNQFVDLAESLNAFNIFGNLVTANGANLMINKTVGQIFSRAFSQSVSYEDPHSATLAAQTPVQFRHITRIPGSAGPVITALNVGFYDNAGVITPVGGGANTSTNFRVWAFATNTTPENILIQYGQNTYASLAAAVAGIGTGNYVPNPTTGAGALLGWISVIRTATNLSDPSQATFTLAGKFAAP